MVNVRRGINIRVGFSVYRNGIPEDMAEAQNIRVVIRHKSLPNSSAVFTGSAVSILGNSLSVVVTDTMQKTMASGAYLIEVAYRLINPLAPEGYDPYIIDSDVFTLTDRSSDVGGVSCGDVTVQVVNISGEVSFCSQALEQLIDEAITTIQSANAAAQAANDAADAAMAIVDSKINIDGLNANVKRLQFDTTNPAAPTAAGQIAWDNDERTLVLHDGLHSHPLGKELELRARNTSGANILNGRACYVTGSTGDNPTIALATNTNGDIAQKTIGVSTMDIANNAFGIVTTFGEVNDIDTSGLTLGAIAYLGANGLLTTTEPVAPTPKIVIGICVRQHAQVGKLFVSTRPIARLSKLSDVFAPTLTDNDVLRWNGTTLRWEVYSLAGKADLVAGKVPTSQLPSYVDDVLEYATLAAFPVTGESGKIYVALNTNLTYRWGGTAYVEISKSLALGETADTAYRGDRGKTAYDHSQATGNPHNTTAAQIPNTPAGTVAATTVQGAINELAGDIVQLETDLNEKVYGIDIDINYTNKLSTISQSNKRYNKYAPSFIAGKSYLIEIIPLNQFTSMLQSTIAPSSVTVVDTISDIFTFYKGKKYYFKYIPSVNCGYLYFNMDSTTLSNLLSIYVYEGVDKINVLETKILGIESAINESDQVISRIENDLEGGDYIDETFEPTYHPGWRKYAFLLPKDYWIGKELRIYSKDIPDGNHIFYPIHNGNIGTTITPTVQVLFEGGYATIDAKNYIPADPLAITHLRLGNASWNTIISTSQLGIIKNKIGLIDQADINTVKIEKIEIETNPLNWNSSWYYQMLWSTMHCTPVMLKNHPWKTPIDWNLNICLNTDTHFHTPDIIRRLNKWNLCFNGNQKSISANLASSQLVYTNEDHSQKAITMFWSLGDMGSAFIITKENVINHWYNIWDSIDSLGKTQRPQLITIGNHDIAQDGQDVSQYFKKEDRYNYIIKPMLARFSSNHLSLDVNNLYSDWSKFEIVTPNIDNPTMWMLDLVSEKVRIISLDCYDWDDSEATIEVRSQSYGYFSENQIDWLINCLNSVPNGYAVFLGTHSAYINQTLYGGNGSIIRDIMIAYKNSTEFTCPLFKVDNITYVKDIYVNFSSSLNSKALWIAGHDHIFSSTPYSNQTIGPKSIQRITAISASGDGGIYRGCYRDMCDIICYNDSQGVRIARYGGVGSKYDVNLNDGGDINGFHFVDNPMSII